MKFNWTFKWLSVACQKVNSHGILITSQQMNNPKQFILQCSILTAYRAGCNPWPLILPHFSCETRIHTLLLYVGFTLSFFMVEAKIVSSLCTQPTWFRLTLLTKIISMNSPFWVEHLPSSLTWTYVFKTILLVVPFSAYFTGRVFFKSRCSQCYQNVRRQAMWKEYSLKVYRIHVRDVF